MGPNNDNSPFVYMGTDGVYMDGVRIGTMGPIREISLVQNEDGSLGFEPSFSVGIDLAKGSDFTGEFELRIPRMSKRKFIKSLMGRGYKRNDATEMAKMINEQKISYGYAYMLNTIGYPLTLLRKGDQNHA